MPILMKSWLLYLTRCLFVSMLFSPRSLSVLWNISIIFKENTFLPFDLPAGGDLQASKGPGQCSGQGTPKRNLNVCDLVGGQQLAEFAIGFKYQPTAWGVRWNYWNEKICSYDFFLAKSPRSISPQLKLEKFLWSWVAKHALYSSASRNGHEFLMRQPYSW